MYKLCRGGGSNYGACFEGHVVLQIVHNASAVCAYIGRQRARNVTDDAGFVEIFVLPTPKFRGGPLIFEYQVVEPPTPTTCKKIQGDMSPRFCCIKVRKCPNFFTKFVGVKV